MIQKVTAFITRQLHDKPHLLLFRHPLTGTQVPAGTVEDGEDLKAALGREIYEETGLDSCTITAYLGCWDNELADNQRISRTPTHLLEAPAADARVKATIGRGVSLPFFATQGAYSEVSYYIIEDEDNHLRLARGWVETADLDTVKERHFYHLDCTAPTPKTWRLKADQDLVFELFWAPLKPKPVLVSGQDCWLDFVYTALQ
jgi:ADP-ribose pyrophosphatase YjhB (NUDIX family)